MINTFSHEHDVIVVGSGAAGAMAAYVLASAGVKVLMLETGRDYDPAQETPMFNRMSEAPLFGEPTPDKQEGYYDASVNAGWDLEGEPYTRAEGSRFAWFRTRMLGGKTNHWGRVAQRWGPYDFKGYTRDSIGFDWPISYEDIAPYYDRVESLIGVFGAAEGIENSPDSPPGILHEPPKARGYEQFLKLVLENKFDIPVAPIHSAILTRQHGDRPSCFYASDCLRGCAIGANFQSTTVLIPPARQTGNLTILTNAHVYQVTVDTRGRANGVKYIDRATGARHRANARAVMLGASACESARILLLSKSGAFPDGLANSSGHVGKHLMDNIKTGVAAQVPALEGLPPYNDEGVSLFHVFSPWWGYDDQRAGRLNFTKGCHLQFWGQRMMPTIGDNLGLARLSGAIGARLHADMKRLYGSIVYISADGEMIPNDDCYCELDPDAVDRWGLPVLRFHWRHGEHDFATAEYQRALLADIFRTMNANILTDLSKPVRESMRTPGSVIHEQGVCRMGDRPDNSVLDAHNRAWDVPGLYVVDGGAFSSNSDKAPTLTILALAWRAADHLTEALRKGEL